MASKRRLRRKSCLGKAAHSTRDGSLIQLWRSRARGLLVYRCNFCKQFHVGHPGRKIRQAITAKREA